MACVQPYGTALGRGNGIAETTVAYIFTFIPLATAISKPICGFIADRTQNATAVLLSLQTIALVSLGVAFSTQYIHNNEDTYFEGHVSCARDKATFVNVSSSCARKSPKCRLYCWRDVPDSASFKFEADIVFGNDTSNLCKLLWSQTAAHAGSSCDFACPCDERSHGLLGFWLYGVFVVMGFVASFTVYVISDAAVCEMLGDDAKTFGRQRLWGTLGFGVAGPLLGVFIDEANRLTEGRSAYTPCLILFAFFLLSDMLLLCCIPRLTMTKARATFFVDVKTVFSCLEMTLFAFWVCLLGVLFTFASSYNTWLLEDLEASKLNIGLYNLAKTSVELPLLFASGKILKLVGFFPSCSLAFASFAVSYVGWSFVRNPWYTLLTAIADGAAFSFMLPAIAVYSKEAAPSGTTASVMCVLNVSFDGIGAALGNLVGGAGFGKYGGRSAFRYAGIAAFTCSVLCSPSQVVIRRRASFVVKRSSNSVETNPSPSLVTFRSVLLDSKRSDTGRECVSSCLRQQSITK